MKAWKRIFPILLIILVLGSICWYLLVYDTAFTRDFLLTQARHFEQMGNHGIATWLYDTAYLQSGKNSQVAIELAEAHKEHGNYSKAEYTLTNAIAANATPELYTALCKTYVEQNKLLDAVTMLDNVSPYMKAQLDPLRPESPVVAPAPGFYRQYLTVTLDAGDNTLYVSTDGEYPSIPEDLYSGPIALSGGETTIYAICVGENGLVSPLSIFGYTVHGVIEEITLKNDSVAQLVRDELNIPQDTPLMSDDLWEITLLAMPADVTDYSDLKYFPYLTSFAVENGKYTDLQALSSLSQLETLIIIGSPVSTKDLETIAALPKLKHLILDNCSLSNIQSLSNAKNLESLILSNNSIRDVSALASLSKLKKLDLSHNAIEDVTPLGTMQGLEVLDLTANVLTTISPLSGCSALKDLNVSQNKLTSLEGISDLTNLTKLYADNNKLTSVDALAANTALTELSLNRNSLTDITKLSALSKLQYISATNNSLSVIPKWAGGCALVKIDLSNNKITSVSPLGGLVNLNTVVLNYNKISNVDDLARCTNLVRVDVMNNPVKNVSKLKALSIIVNYTPAV